MRRGGERRGLALPVDRWTTRTRPRVYILFPLAGREPAARLPPRHLTKTELALELLRERIRSGELAPGQRLAIDELTRLLGMSATPIREALRLLQADRLVDYRPHHGVVVTEMPSRGDGRDLPPPGRARAARRRAGGPELSPDQLAELERLHAVLRAAVASGRGKRIADAQRRLALGAVRARRTRIYLNDFIRRLWDGFPWRTMWALPGRAERSVREHEAMMETIRTATIAARRQLA